MKVHSFADASPDFQDLISQLLVKNPAARLTWKAMCEHPFWQTPLSQRPMPPEPMLDAFINSHGLRPVAQPAAVQANGQLEAHVKAAQVSYSTTELVVVVDRECCGCRQNLLWW